MRKETIQEVVDELPDETEVNFDAFLEKLYLLQKIEEGEEQIAEGRTMSHEEVVKRLEPWLK